MTKSLNLLSSWLILGILFICLTANGIQLTNQQQIKNRNHQQQKINQKINIKNKIETKVETKAEAESKANQRTEEEVASDAFTQAEGNIIKSSSVDDQAMYEFSKAMLNGEKVMDLPDKPVEKGPEISDEQAMQLYTETQDQLQIQITEQQIEEQTPKVSEEVQSKILEFNDAVEKIIEKPKEKPTQEMQDSQAAIDAVSIVIPEGMEVKTHRQAQGDENVQMDNEFSDQSEVQVTKEQNQKLDSDSTEAEVQSQAALDFIAVQDPSAMKPMVIQAKPQMEHLFDGPDDVPVQKKEEPYVASKLLDAENQAQLNAKAATDDVKVQQINDPSKENQQTKEPLMPKSMAPKKKHHVSESEVERSIRMAEKSQDGDEEQEEQQEDQLEAQISGSENVWESQLEMGSITEKLTRSKDYKTPAQMAKLQKVQEKKEKQRIIDELLAPNPISTDDMKEYAGALAQQSVQSKSEVEIEEENAAKKAESQKKIEQQKQANEQKKQAIALTKKKDLENENALIKQGQMARMQSKNDKDQQSLNDLQALEKLQRSSSLTQIDGLAEQAALDEKDRADQQNVDDNVQAIKDEADKEEQEIEKESQSPAASTESSAPDFSNLRKVKELSQKLGVKAQPGDANLGSKEKIAEAMVQRAIQAGKTQDEIKKAMS